MSTFTIYDPSSQDKTGAYRGAGRNIQALKENISDVARFVTHLDEVHPSDTLFIPLWRPFQKPLLSKRIAERQILWLYDVIPLKFPEHFPVGIRGRWWLYQNTRSLHVFDDILTVSHHSKHDIHSYLGIDLKHIHVAPNTTSSLFFNKPVPLISKKDLHTKYALPNKPYAVYVGDSNWNKNLPHMALGVIESGIICVCVGKIFEKINTLRSLPHEQQEQHIQAMIHPEERPLRDFIKLVLHDDHFIFPGYVPDEHMPSFFKHALCNILYSYDEGYGLSYLEAATQKCPSILADVDIFHETAEQTALFADPQNPSELAQQIMALQKNPKRARHMGQDAYHRSKESSPEAFRKAILRLIQ